jgi:hypothetical protein
MLEPAEPHELGLARRVVDTVVGDREGVARGIDREAPDLVA